MFSRPLLRSCFLWVVCALLSVGLAACVKKSGEATVLSKEYLPATSTAVEGQKEPLVSPEQWKVKVEMRSDLRKVDVLVEASEWDKLKIGDRVAVRYSQGKYTGTIWYSELK